ncbi:hypothetical protein [Aeromicrobium sp. CTD01-1L150]|uniref:hypothetical protein n=1 Tax=Aeromicrobium sp. CTD01-1L150 TaxID=3341830 RepID=UPI0035BEED70
MSTPQPRVMSAQETAALDRVRRRVGALVFFAVVIHGVLGLIGVAHVVVDEPGRHGTAVGLLVMSGVVAAIMYVGIRLILGARLVSPVWMLLAALPTILGASWVL